MKNQNEKLFLSERNWSSRVDHKSKGNASDVSSCRYKIMFVGSVCLNKALKFPPRKRYVGENPRKNLIKLRALLFLWNLSI